jgi:dTDP-glucose 4,6-dehydratase
MARILVTGSAGFLGSNLIRYLIFNNKNTNIIGVDRLKNISDIHNVYINKSSEFYLADVCDIDTMNKIFELSKPDYVIHLASVASNSTNNINDIMMINNNINGLKNIATLCVKFNSKLIYVSTTDVYNYIEQTKKIETSGLYPSNKYIVSKICCENLLNVFGLENNLNYNIVRTTEVFGPRQHNGVVVDMFLDIKGHEKINLYSKGNTVRDILHIEDFSSAISILLDKGADKEIYNLSANVDFTELEIAATIIETIGEGKIEFIDADIDNKYVEIDCDKIKNIGWKSLKKFKNRIKDSIIWYNNNQWFFK